MRRTVLVGFPYAKDGITAVHLPAGQEADIRDDLVPGLVAAGLLERLETDDAPVALDARPEGVAGQGRGIPGPDPLRLLLAMDRAQMLTYAQETLGNPGEPPADWTDDQVRFAILDRVLSGMDKKAMLAWLASNNIEAGPASKPETLTARILDLLGVKRPETPPPASDPTGGGGESQGAGSGEGGAP